MEFDDTGPQRAHGPGPDLRQEIQDSFQVILDALDAARADLYAVGGQHDRPVSSPPSWQRAGEPAMDAGSTDATPPPCSLPAPSPSRRAQPVGPQPEGRDPDTPHAVEPDPVERQRTGGAGRAEARKGVVVEPLWVRGRELVTAPLPLSGTPPPVEKPHMAGAEGPVYAAPPVAFPPPQEGPPGRTGSHSRTCPRPYTGGPVTVGRPAPTSDQPPAPSSESAPPREPAHKRNRSRGWRRFTDRQATRVAGVFGLGAAGGLILASSLLGSDNPAPPVSYAPSGQPDRPPQPPESPAPPVSSPPSGQPDRPLQPPDNRAPALPEIPGTGVLRQGDRGHGVYELQVRLLQVPNIYDGGAIDGRYDEDVRAAVARLQHWYGIRGDETGVYGDNTRHALMLRTK
ncbi:peptidoglycan-binding domain-containing protein [Wenjunlia tyrosinilytica]|uniref:Peptidoglycan binding-like domain-containing protein n=1 Tax=Wenjunlia tyrosinilytica TaxID=1544741 RepID=A0A918E374_9ACTN|nr:peptidoglycan-binding domain-containing protein [Wenjunlia tyrosinilytica]GGP00907.1 hypothetical protein GCM10012280_70670 [Wenjunlia tyrosinilytica]